MSLAQTRGALLHQYEAWRDRLVQSLAFKEAEIDFMEDQALDPRVVTKSTSPKHTMTWSNVSAVSADVDHLIVDIEKHLSDARRGERLRSGVSVVILGAPNAGKSSLLNAFGMLKSTALSLRLTKLCILVQRPAAIVSDIPGTTRDIIEVALDLGGYSVLNPTQADIRQISGCIGRYRWHSRNVRCS